MDLDYARQSGYAAWQVIPLFFVTYIGMVLIFAGGGQVAFFAQLAEDGSNRYMEHNQKYQHFVWKQSWSWNIFIAGSCVLSVAVLWSIVACVIIPVIRKVRQRARQPGHIPEPEIGSVEGEIKTWYASSPSDVQEVQESLHTLPHR